ncbi:MAG: spermidine/putrescine ABC transporter substrate-binding protein [Solirubrobacterales bacterium]
MSDSSVDRLLADRLSRRDVMKISGGLALSASLAACGVGSDQNSSADTTKAIEAKIDGDLVYFNWNQYLDPGLIKDFEKEYGVTVRQSNFDSMAGMMAKLRSGNQYDVIFPSAEFAQKLIRANQLLEIPRSQLTAIDDVYPFFNDPWYDTESAHTVPYSLYLTGLGYRADKIDTMTGSWNDLINPQADGRSFILDDFQEGIGMANLVNGYELNAAEPSQLDEAKDYLVGIKPELRGFSSDTITNMASGNAWIQHLWNGDIINARYRVDDPSTLKFQQNEEGVPVGSDTFAIPVNAEHPGTALVFINFVLERSARNSTWTGYPMPTKSSEKPYADLVAGEPELQITVDDLEAGQEFANLEGQAREDWDRTWTEVKAS